MNALSSVSDLWFAWIMTCMIHSTVLLFACWVMPRFVRSPSHALTERFRKIVAMGAEATLTRLDSELASLNKEIGQVAALSDRQGDTKEVADQIARIRAAASLLQRNRQGLSKRFSQE